MKKFNLDFFFEKFRESLKKPLPSISFGLRVNLGMTIRSGAMAYAAFRKSSFAISDTNFLAALGIVIRSVCLPFLSRYLAVVHDFNWTFYEWGEGRWSLRAPQLIHRNERVSGASVASSPLCFVSAGGPYRIPKEPCLRGQPQHLHITLNPEGILALNWLFLWRGSSSDVKQAFNDFLTFPVLRVLFQRFGYSNQYFSFFLKWNMRKSIFRRNKSFKDQWIIWCLFLIIVRVGVKFLCVSKNRVRDKLICKYFRH